MRKGRSARWWVVITVRAVIGTMFVVAALMMARHPTISGVLVTIASLYFAFAWWMLRKGEALAAAVARADVDAIERIAENSLVHRYEAIVLLGLVGSVERARALGRVTPCVCGKCEAEELDRELTLALRGIELVDRGDARQAVKLSPAYAMRHALLLYAALMTGLAAPRSAARIANVAKNAAAMRWPLEVALARCLMQQGDVEGSRRQLENAPPPWRERFQSLARASRSR